MPDDKIVLTRADLLGYARVRGMTVMAQDQVDTIVHLDSDVDLRRVPAHIAHGLGHIHDSFGECVKRRKGPRCGQTTPPRYPERGDVVTVVGAGPGAPFEPGVVTVFDDPMFKAWSESNRPKAPSNEALAQRLLLVVFPTVGRWGWYAPHELQVVTEEAGS
jgi:hypothetical protein